MKKIPIIGAAFVLCAAIASAQNAATVRPTSQASVGMVLPVIFDHGHHIESGQDNDDGGTRKTIGAWLDVVAFKSPRLAFHTGFQFPRAYLTHETHAGSGGFVSALSHRDVTL